MEYSPQLNDWTILYTKEATRIELQVLPEQVPTQARPLVIATIYIENNANMLIDIRSIERATQIIEFINSYIPNTVTEITHAAIYNELITVTHQQPESARDIDYDDIFNEKRMTIIDPNKAAQEMEAISAQYDDKQEALKVLIKNSEEKSKKPLPKVEKFPVHYYEEGISQFEWLCKMRQMIAMQHFLGHKNFFFHDLIYKKLSNSKEFKELAAKVEEEIVGT
jgi:hypothetical protein